MQRLEAMETMELKLNSPITKEQWKLLTDANLEHSDTMWFSTPNGNNFEYKKVRNGKWEDDGSGYLHKECGMYFDHYLWTGKMHEQFLEQCKYCPRCGARMESE